MNGTFIGKSAYFITVFCVQETNFRIGDILDYYLYRKILKISPSAYIFQRLFLRGLFLEGLLLGGAYLQREICISKSMGLAI